jgi:hypothetical protein
VWSIPAKGATFPFWNWVIADIPFRYVISGLIWFMRVVI